MLIHYYLLLHFYFFLGARFGDEVDLFYEKAWQLTRPKKLNDPFNRFLEVASITAMAPDSEEVGPTKPGEYR
jgi:hypothetical protein